MIKTDGKPTICHGQIACKQCGKVDGRTIAGGLVCHDCKEENQAPK